MGFNAARFLLVAPLQNALAAGHSEYGMEWVQLDDEFVRAIPKDLREELALWVIEAAENEVALKVNVPRSDVGTVVRALQRERDQRVDRAAKQWLARPDAAWVNEDYGISTIKPEVEALASHPEVAHRLSVIKTSEARKEEEWESALSGLRDYALRVPEFARAAKENYDIRAAAVAHFAQQIASFQEDALILSMATDEYKQSKFEERSAPDPYAFGILDDVTSHVHRLPRPAGIAVRIERIMRMRRAFKKGKSWTLNPPVTIVGVVIEPVVTMSRMVVFFADAEERRLHFSRNDDDDDEKIPF